MSVEAIRVLEIHSSPHVRAGHSVDRIMWNVCWALLPVAAFGIFAFGWAALATLVVAVAACVGFEHLACLLGRRPTTVGDGSAAVTGLLYGLTLPPTLPLWMNVVGALAAIGVGKALFGGLGFNAFNPALVGRAFLQAAFPVSMTTWMPGFGAERFAGFPSSTLTLPFTQPVYQAFDGFSGATPLAAWKFERAGTAALELGLGQISGSTGETSAILILCGGLYLVARHMMSWRIPVAILATVAAISGALHLVDPGRYASPQFMLLSGGLMLGAVFMATDMVASPLTPRGLWLYGALIGALTVVIRVWGGMPEGVMYAILLANAVSPHIDRWLRTVPYGTRKAKR